MRCFESIVTIPQLWRVTSQALKVPIFRIKGSDCACFIYDAKRNLQVFKQQYFSVLITYKNIMVRDKPPRALVEFRWHYQS